MRRLLLSLSLILAALAVIGVGATYAPFTDTTADSGSVTASDSEIRLNTLAGVDEVHWNGGGCIADNMSPGDICTEELEVHNDGSVAIYYTIVDLETACFDVSHDPPIDTTFGDDGINPGHLAPGETETINATVTLVDDDDCQAESASVGIQVNGSSDP